MKEGIHPKYHKAKVTCTCGNEFEVGSTVDEIKLDICSACHPFFTGKQKFVDTAGRVDKFFRKYGEEAQRKFVKKKTKRKRLSDEEVEAMEKQETAQADASDEAEAPAEPEAPAEAADAAADQPEQETPAAEAPAEGENAAEEAPAEEKKDS